MDAPLQSLTRDRDTVEYLSYQFDTVTDETGTPVTPPTSYDLAAVPQGTRPTSGDWHAAPWLAGPMTAGWYDLYLRFTDTPEQPTRYIALLHVV